MKTNFSFDVQYSATSDSTQAQRDEVMDSLGPTLQKLLAAQDKAATVMVSESHKGNGNKLVELTTTLADAQIAEILKAFSAQHGVVVAALE
jgi:hypothetical protein